MTCIFECRTVLLSFVSYESHGKAASDVGEYSVAALLGIVLNLVLPCRSSDAEAEEAPPVPREDYGDLSCDFKRAENESEEKR